jgi:hypothetical protein
MESLVGVLLICMGVLAAGVGVLVADRSLRSADRVYRRIAAGSAGAIDGWGAWFLEGFSGVGTGLRGLIAVGIWLFWTFAGLALIGLGVSLFDLI